jgi:N-acetylneuraminic acid mutarotase
MNKAFFTFFFLLAFASFAQTPNSWTRIVDFGGIGRESAVAFSIDSFGYVGALGEYDSDTIAGNRYPTDFWQYNPATNAWIQKANFPGQGRIDAISFVIGSKAYVGLGYLYKDFWEYDPATDAWTQKADFGGGARDGAACFSTAGKGYVGLGNSDTASAMKDFWEYDPTTDIWTQKNDFIGGVRTNAVGLAIANEGYIGFGIQSAGMEPMKDFWMYNSDSDTWTRKADFIGEPKLAPFTFVIANKGYLGTGTDSLYSDDSDFWEYDSSTDTWTQKDSFGGGNRFLSAGFSIGNRGYAGTGTTGSLENCVKDFWMYTPDSIATGITELTNQMQVLFYPNPVEDAGILQIYSDANTKATIDMIDQQGRTIETIFKGDLSGGDTTFNIDTKQLTSGMYFITITSSMGKRTIKFTKI